MMFNAHVTFFHLATYYKITTVLLTLQSLDFFSALPLSAALLPLLEQFP